MKTPLRRSALTMIALSAVLGAVLVAPMTASAAGGGSVLLDETFQGSSVANGNIAPLNSACLTGGSTNPPPSGASTLTACSSSIGGPARGTPGYLQLTDNRGSQVGGIVSNQVLPANRGLEVTFDQYQYGGTGADGISFFLTDGSAQLTSAGAVGGALGYGATAGTENGVHAAYLGVGLDAYGNFKNLGQGTGCPNSYTSSPNTVSIAGPGDGTAGYCMLASATPPGQLRSAKISAVGVRIIVSAAVRPEVTVELDFKDGNGFRPLLGVTMPTDAPSTYKFGFSSSTGGSTDVHLIRGLKVASVEPLDRLAVSAQVDRTAAQPATYAVGSTVPYQFLVTNTGPSLTSFAVTSPQLENITCPRTTLESAAASSSSTSTTTSSMVCTGTHTLTAADVAAGDTFEIVATASGLERTTTVTSKPASVSVAVPAPALTVATSGAIGDDNDNAVADLGETVTYSYLVANTGNTTLSAVGVTDAGDTVTCPAANVLAADASLTCTSSHTVTQADIDAGTVGTSATAHGTPSSGTVVSSASSDASVPVTTRAAISLVKSAATTPFTSAGQVVEYSFLVTNSGDVTLTDAEVAEGTFTGSGVAPVADCPAQAASLAPGSSVTCTASYTLTQADIDAGTVTNDAVATASTPRRATVTSASSSAPVSATATPALTLSNSVGSATYSAVGQSIGYGFTVTNTGNVTLSAVGIARNGPSAVDATCLATSLAPGESTTCAAAHVVTQADLDRGSITDSHVAVGTAPKATTPTTSASAPIVATAIVTPAVTVTATPSATTYSRAGDTISYTYTVANTGNVTLTTTSVVEGVLGTTQPVTCAAGAASLAPGDTVVCTTVYTVTQADVDAGVLTTSVAVHAQAPSGSTLVSDVSAVTTTAQISAAVSLAITVDHQVVRSVGQTIVYTYTVANTGNVTLSDVAVITSAFSGSGQLSEFSRRSATTSIAPDQSVVFTATYAATKADASTGRLMNTATALAATPLGAALPSDPANAEVMAAVPADDDTVVVAAAPAAVVLAATGDGSAPVVAASALVLLMLGLTLLVGARRRRRA